MENKIDKDKKRKQIENALKRHFNEIFIEDITLTEYIYSEAYTEVQLLLDELTKLALD